MGSFALLAADGETGDGGFGSGVGQQQFKRRGDVRRASLRTTTEVLSRDARFHGTWQNSGLSMVGSTRSGPYYEMESYRAMHGSLRAWASGLGT